MAKKTKKQRQPASGDVATNRRARHKFEPVEKMEALWVTKTVEVLAKVAGLSQVSAPGPSVQVNVVQHLEELGSNLEMLLTRKRSEVVVEEKAQRMQRALLTKPPGMGNGEKRYLRDAAKGAVEE